MIKSANLTPLGELLRDMTIRAFQTQQPAPTVGDALKLWANDSETRLAYDPRAKAA